MANPFFNAEKKLGFGCMRLPLKDGEPDYPQICEMFDHFLSQGFCYFDTAHGYMKGQNEEILKKCLTSRYPRDRYMLTDKLTVTVTAKNTGAVPGKTVVQLYVGKGQTDQVIRPVRELKGFDKVFLNPGESKDVSFTLDKRSFAYWNDELGDWHVETGEYTVSIGHSSRDLAVCAAVKVNSTVKIPTYYTLDTIFMDLMADPEAVKALAPILDAIKKALVPGSDDKTAAASEAITEEMNLAMLNYMPLRGILSFGGGAISPEAIEAILDKLNNA